MGDSMAQGFKNGGVYRTDLSFPALLARSLKLNSTFDTPSFSGQAGIPLNLEVLVRGLSEEFGDSISWNQYLPVVRNLYLTLKRIKNHWEDENNHRNRKREMPYHNQGVWGFAANDSWLMTEKKCREYVKVNKPRYSVFSVLPDHAMYITGRLVLNPGFIPEYENYSQIDNIVRLHNDGGVENLIVCTGHNNIAGALSALKIIYTDPGFLSMHHFEREFTVYRPEHFEEEMRYLYEQIAAIGIPNVFVPTLPYMTIPPVTRGVNADLEKGHTGYFDYYTRFWIWDEDFNPEIHPHLTKEDAIQLDQLIDRYNAIIRNLADKFGFHLVPIGKHVSAVARRRLGVNKIRPFPDGLVEALKRNEATSHLVDSDGAVRLSTDYLRVNENTRKITQGGIFSLDGLHPSTIGYGMIADVYRMVMEKAGVEFDQPIDWDYIIENETLVSDPPYLLSELRLLLRFLSLGHQERITKIGQNILQQLLDLFGRTKSEEVGIN
jgi:hypothetical protein